MTFSTKNQTALETRRRQWHWPGHREGPRSGGRQICLAGRNVKKLTDTATLCGSGAVYRVADLADEASIRKLAEFGQRNSGPVGYSR